MTVSGAQALQFYILEYSRYSSRYEYARSSSALHTHLVKNIRLECCDQVYRRMHNTKCPT